VVWRIGNVGCLRLGCHFLNSDQMNNRLFSKGIFWYWSTTTTTGSVLVQYTNGFGRPWFSFSGLLALLSPSNKQEFVKESATTLSRNQFLTISVFSNSISQALGLFLSGTPKPELIGPFVHGKKGRFSIKLFNVDSKGLFLWKYEYSNSKSQFGPIGSRKDRSYKLSCFVCDKWINVEKVRTKSPKTLCLVALYTAIVHFDFHFAFTKQTRFSVALLEHSMKFVTTFYFYVFIL
jgi:hypothetical protein